MVWDESFDLEVSAGAGTRRDGDPKIHGVAMTTTAVSMSASRNRLSISDQGTIMELDRSRRREGDGIAKFA